VQKGRKLRLQGEISYAILKCTVHLCEGEEAEIRILNGLLAVHDHDLAKSTESHEIFYEIFIPHKALENA
jgi:hypothetical protein